MLYFGFHHIRISFEICNNKKEEEAYNLFEFVFFVYNIIAIDIKLVKKLTSKGGKGGN